MLDIPPEYIFLSGNYHLFVLVKVSARFFPVSQSKMVLYLIASSCL